MKKKRDRMEVVYDFLKIIKDNGNSMKPTPLLRFSNLSSQRFSEYLRELEEKGFVKVLPGRKNKRIITLQNKGFEFLAKYRTMREFIDEFGL
jgi:predicted transcriptional regulator